MNNEEYILQCVKQLPRKILRIVETEINTFKELHVEDTKEIDAMYKRLRKSILDTLGDVSRLIEE